MQRTGLFKARFEVMPWRKWLLVLIASLCVACVGSMHRATAQEVSDNSADDVSYLDQYGTWIDVQPYGNVWQPSVSADWRPFTYGHWTWTDAGWAWVSYEPYGWMVYHYGNWDYTPEAGWFWIEGSDWSPARVEWMNYDGYSSWAPMPPAGRVWQDPWHPEGLRFWVVVRSRDLDRDNIGHRRIGRPPVPQDRDGRDVHHGPLEVHDFEKISGRTVKPEAIRHDPAPVYMHPLKPVAAENRVAEPRPIGNGTQGNHPVMAQPPEVKSVETPRVQFHKMILPPNEDARINKYSPQVQKKVLKPKKTNKPLPPKAAKTKDKK